MTVQSVQPLWHTGEHALRTPYGILLPPGGRIAAYVRSTGVKDYDPPEVAENLKATLSAALLACRPGMNDTIIVLPGHTENVVDATMMNNLKSGTRIIGVGEAGQDNQPLFTWTNTAGSWVIDDTNVTIEGIKLAVTANGVTKGIVVTGGGFRFVRNQCLIATGATAKFAIFLEVGTAADFVKIYGNKVYGTATHNVTDCFKVVAAVNGFEFVGNTCIASATAANGLLHFTAAALLTYVGHNTIYNTHTASTAAITVDAVALDGLFEFNRLAVKNTGAITSLTHGFNVNAACIAAFFENRVANDPRATGIVSPTADT